MTVYARYLLIFLSAWLLGTDDLPAPVAEAIAAMALDPQVISDVAGLLSGAGAVLWYWFSRARRALKNADILESLVVR